MHTQQYQQQQTHGINEKRGFSKHFKYHKSNEKYTRTPFWSENKYLNTIYFFWNLLVLSFHPIYAANNIWWTEWILKLFLTFCTHLRHDFSFSLSTIQFNWAISAIYSSSGEHFSRQPQTETALQITPHCF